MSEVATQVDQDELLSGRDLDAAIAERLMGFSWWRSRVSGKRCLFPEGRQYGWFTHRATGDEELTTDYDHKVPCYSSSIEDAMQVIEKMMGLGYRYVMRGNFENNGLHHAAFDHAEWADANPLYQSPVGSSLPEAVCRAALAAMEIKK